MNPYAIPGLDRPEIQIWNMVARHFGLKPEQMKERTNKKNIVEPRQVACYLIRKYVRKLDHNYYEREIPYSRISEVSGNRGHAQIIHGLNKIKSLPEWDELKSEVNILEPLAQKIARYQIESLKQ